MTGWADNQTGVHFREDLICSWMYVAMLACVAALGWKLQPYPLLSPNCDAPGARATALAGMGRRMMSESPAAT